MPSFLITPVSSNQSLKEVIVEEGTGGGFLSSGNKIVIIEVEGMLLNAKTGGFLQAQENDVSLFAQQLKKAEKDPAVKAIVLRVNSPGGTVSASDLMYDEVKRFKQLTNKPVVASAQDIVASGAYYVSCSADKIVVQPTSVIGSIGVIFNTFDLSGTLDGGIEQQGGVAILDHRQNIRHPSPWYGGTEQYQNYLNAAFLFHEPLEVEEGETLSFRYRVIVHDGVWDQNRLAAEYDKYTSVP